MTSLVPFYKTVIMIWSFFKLKIRVKVQISFCKILQKYTVPPLESTAEAHSFESLHLKGFLYGLERTNHFVQYN